MSSKSTKMGGGGSRFPSTCWTVIRDAADPGARGYRNALERLAMLYWRPVYAHLRRRWGKSSEDAKDLTQGFFAALCEREFLSRIAPEGGLFRAYVRAAVDNFARLDHRVRMRLKRGGGKAHVPLDQVKEFEPSESAPADRAFELEWARAVLDQALREMERLYRGAGKETVFRLFVMKHVGPPEGKDPSYADLAQEFGMQVTEVTNHLHRAKRKLQELVYRQVRETVDSDDAAEREIADLFESLG